MFGEKYVPVSLEAQPISYELPWDWRHSFNVSSWWLIDLRHVHIKKNSTLKFKNGREYGVELSMIDSLHKDVWGEGEGRSNGTHSSARHWVETRIHLYSSAALLTKKVSDLPVRWLTGSQNRSGSCEEEKFCIFRDSNPDCLIVQAVT
jgi:hypothetical protein